MPKNFLLRFVLPLIFLAVIGACASPTPQTVVKTYQVITSADYPPFEFIDTATNEIIGFDIDLIQEIAGRANFQVEINHIPFTDLVSAMAKCQMDHIYISAMPVRQFREGEETCYRLYTVGPGGDYQFIGDYCSVSENPIYFSDPYFHSGHIVVVQSEAKTINGKNDLINKKVGIQIGTIDDDEIASWGAEIYKFEDLDSTVKFLLDDGTDAVVMGYGSALKYINQYPGEIKTVGDLITDIPYVIAVCDYSPGMDLFNKINEALGEIKTDGTLQTLTDQWFGSD